MTSSVMIPPGALQHALDIGPKLVSKEKRRAWSHDGEVVEGGLAAQLLDEGWVASMEPRR